MTRSPDLIDLLAQDAWARRLARSLARGPEDAEDLVQEAYTRALTPGAAPVAHGRGWFARVLRNVSIRRHQADSAREQHERAHARARATVGGLTSLRDAVDEPRDDEPSPDELAARAEVQERLAAAVLALEPRQRDVVLLRHFDDASIAAIARRLGLAPATVHEHLARGHAELRRKLASWGTDTRLSGGLALLLAGRDSSTAAAVAGAAVVLPSSPLLLLMTMSKLTLGVAVAAALTVLLWRALADVPERDVNTLRDGVTLAGSDETTEPPAANVSSAGSGPAATRVAATTAPPSSTRPATGKATLRVKVVDERGIGVAGARAWVDIRPKSALAPFATVHTPAGADGVVTLTVDADRALTIVAREPRTSSLESVTVTPLAPGALADVTIAVRTIPDVELSLRVVDAQTNDPVPGARLYVEKWLGPRAMDLLTLPPPGVEAAVSDEEGLVRVQAKSWTVACCTVLANGYGPRVQVVRKHDATSQADRRPILVKLPPSSRIEGVVIGAVTDAEVRAQFFHSVVEQSESDVVDYLGTGSYELRTRVTAAGTFAHTDLPVGADVSLALHLSGMDEPRIKTAVPLKTVAGEVQRVSWDLTVTRRFVCTVREVDGTPVPGQAVGLYSLGEIRAGAHQRGRGGSHSPRTDDAGVVVFDGVEPGPWQIGLVPAGYRHRAERLPSDREFAPYTISVDMPALEGDVPVELTLHRDLYIEGRVVVPDGGAPIMSIRATSDRFTALVQPIDVVDGKFRVGPLLPGDYAVSAHPNVDDSAPPSHAASTPVQAQAGSVDVELVLRAGAKLTLRAVDAVTREAVNAQFTLSRCGEDVDYDISMGTSERHEVNGLVPGSYFALAMTPSGRCGLLEGLILRPNESLDATVALAPGGRLVVQVPENRALCDLYLLRGDCLISQRRLERGDEDLSILPPGPYRVGIVRRERGAALQWQRIDPFDAVRAVEVRAGEETTLVLDP